MADPPEEQLETPTEKTPNTEGQSSGKSRSGIRSLLGKGFSIFKPLKTKLLGSKQNRIKSSVAGGLGLLLAVYFLFFSGGSTIEDMLAESLIILAENKSAEDLSKVEDIAIILLEEDRNTEFPGAGEYLMGIVTFRNAMESPKHKREFELKKSIRYLKEARNHGVPIEHLPELSYAVGVSLFDIGSSLESREYLEYAVGESLSVVGSSMESEENQDDANPGYPPGKTEAGSRLINVYLDQPTPTLMDRSLKLCQSLLTSDDLNEQQKQQLLLQKSQIHLNLQEYNLAENTLRTVQNLKTESHALQIFQARTLMTEGAAWMSGKQIRSAVPLASLVFRATGVEIYQKAIDLLDPITGKDKGRGFDKSSPRQATYLMGVAAEKLADDREQERDSIRYDEAINYYLRTVNDYRGSHEEVAANLRVANLLRKSGRDEEALLGFQKALNSLEKDDPFRNRWLSKIEFEEAVVLAWQSWTDQNDFENAIELSRTMHPLISIQRALEFQAIARQKWAEHLVELLPTLPYLERVARNKVLLEKWKQSGEAYSELANSIGSTNEYRQMLWIAAEHYRKGHDFEKSLRHFTRFINSNPERRHPQALVGRGEVLIDLDRIDEAIEHFQKVISTYQTDPAFFRAMYLLGVCYKEQNEPEKAKTVWRKILTSPLLEPTAKEWKNTLFALGQFVFDRSSSDQDKLKPDLLKLHRRWNEVVHQLEEFLNRYPQDPRQNEARFMLAKSLQHSTKYLQLKLSQAETANRRQELEHEIVNKLIRARDEYRLLQKSLHFNSKDQRYFSFEEQLFLKDSYFDLAHTYYDLAAFNSEYDKAIISYNSAVNRYSQDPRVILSYLQIADCNLKLEKPLEAHSVLVQARVSLGQFPDSVFDSPNTNYSRKEWEKWIDLFLKFNVENSGTSKVNSTNKQTPQ